MPNADVPALLDMCASERTSGTCIPQPCGHRYCADKIKDAASLHLLAARVLVYCVAYTKHLTDADWSNPHFVAEQALLRALRGEPTPNKP